MEISVNNTGGELLPALYGSYISQSKACAYCPYHKCYLSVAMLKQHECLKKQCDALQKDLTHDYWRQREQKKIMKKMKKVEMQYA